MARKKRLIDQDVAERIPVSEAMIHELRAGIRLREEELVKAEKYLTDRQEGAQEGPGAASAGREGCYPSPGPRPLEAIFRRFPSIPASRRSLRAR